MKMKIFKNSTVKLNTLFAILIAALVLIVFFLNATMYTLSERYPLSIDLNANAAYQIGDDTKEVLNLLEDDITIYVLSSKESLSGTSYLVQMQRVLEQYRKYSPRVQISYIDYVSDPTFASNYPDLDLSSGDVLIAGPEGVKQIAMVNMFNYTYDAEGNLKIVSSRAEEALTSGIISALTADPVSVAFLNGNGTSQDSAALKSILKDNNFVVSDKNLVTDDYSDCDVLFLLGPTADLSEDILNRFDSFLKNNGEYGKVLFVSADVSQPALSNLSAFLREWGMEIGDGAVFETSEKHAYSYQPYYPLVSYTDETFAGTLKNPENPFLMPLSKPLSGIFEYKDNRTVTELLSFYETSGVRPSDADDSFTAAKATEWGPMPAMLMSTLQIPGQDGKSLKSSVILSASTAALSGTSVSNTSLNNANYLIGMLNTLYEREDAVSIEAKSLGGGILGISTSAATTWGIILCIAVPLLILAAGIAIYLVRRYK